MDSSADHEILLVEDNPGDAALFRHSLAESDIQAGLHVSSTGEDALSFLEDRGGSGDGLSIDLIVLDLNLPGKSGIEVLEELKGEAPMEATPILILSTSGDQNEIQRAYELGANAYLVKRTDFEDIVSLMQVLEEFWLTTAELPD